jgi:hypothetical protein
MRNKKTPGEDGIKDLCKCIWHATKPFYSLVQRMPTKRSFPNEMENSETDPHNQTWERKQRRSIKVSPNKSAHCRWESIGESLNKQNKLPCLFTRLYEHPPVRFYVSKRHNRRGHVNKGIRQGRPSSRGNYSSNKLRRKRCFWRSVVAIYSEWTSILWLSQKSV